MSLTFTTAEAYNTSNGVKMLVYGLSGSGKTVLAATMPRPVLIAAEPGALALRKANLEALFGVGNPSIQYNMPIIEIKTTDDLVEAHRWCLSSAEAKAFDSIAIDSLSEIGEVVLNNAKRQVKDPRQAYNELIEKTEQCVRLFRDLPQKHVYMAAKMHPLKDEMTGVVKYGPGMPGSKLGPNLPYFFDEVFRLGVNKDLASNTSYRFLQTTADLQHEAKDRSGALKEMEPPHLGIVINKIMQQTSQS
jgi:hypothetical protein